MPSDTHTDQLLDSWMTFPDPIRTRGVIKHIEKQEVLRFMDDEKRQYMWDGTELYRLRPLKGKG